MLSLLQGQLRRSTGTSTLNSFLFRTQITQERSLNRESPLCTTRFRSVSLNESDRVCFRFTRETHVAGTEGDRLSALRVKEQWEELLGIEKSREGRVFDAGTKQDRRALMGTGCKGHGRRWRIIIKRIKRFFFFFFSESRKHPRPHPHPLLSTPRVWISSYYPLLNYPTSSSITLTPSNSTTPTWSAKLEEDVFETEDPTSRKGVKVFHGFSKNGTGEGKLVYAGRGRKEDYERLKEEGELITFEPK